MPRRRLFDVDSVTGLTRYYHDSDDGNTFSIETVADVEPIIEDNKTLFNGESSKGRNWKGDMHRVASIPMLTYMDLQSKGILDDEKALSKWLNDPENRFYRTKGGRV